jgi:hypothetical protein
MISNMTPHSCTQPYDDGDESDHRLDDEIEAKQSAVSNAPRGRLRLRPADRQGIGIGHDILPGVRT